MSIYFAKIFKAEEFITCYSGEGTFGGTFIFSFQKAFNSQNKLSSNIKSENVLNPGKVNELRSEEKKGLGFSRIDRPKQGYFQGSHFSTVCNLYS